ncbi:hypothetical protein DQG23_22970 [Paenibacillus contaminans]|uniref:Uncharacterized protein n=1 Tax=Paenibacillus contaminans TaxID=450362 RepID=A0A329MGE6_9BACL|nr:hypothetical protein DQG23_22970 [Paenibacillus contaminans]
MRAALIFYTHMQEFEFARLEQGIKASLTLEFDFARLENGFSRALSQIAAVSGRFRTAGEERDPDSIPIGQNRTLARASDEREGGFGT